MAPEQMDLGSLLTFALLLSLVIALLRTLWLWLLALLVLGPPAFAGVVAGHFIGGAYNSVAAGVAIAVVVAGVLGDVLRSALRQLRRPC